MFFKTSTNEEGWCIMARHSGLVLDVNNPDEINHLVATISTEFAAPYILVNNAAITQDNLAMRMKTEEWNSVINTNLNSIFHTSKQIFHLLI